MSEVIHFLKAMPTTKQRSLFNLIVTLLMAGGLIAMAIWLYARTLDFPLVFDDNLFFQSGYVARYAAEVNLFAHRFLSCASFAHQFMLQGADYHSFHLVNIVLHGLTGTAIFFFLKSLINIQLPQLQPFSMWGAGLAAAIFVIHPAHVYAVAYLVERSVIMATLGAIVMWWAWLQAISAPDDRRFKWLALAVFAYYFSVYSKEHAALIVAGPFALSLLLHRRYKVTGIGYGVAFGLCLAIGLYAAYLGRRTLGQMYEPMANIVLLHDVGPQIHGRSILTQCGLFFKYLFLWLWPDTTRMSVDMRESLVNSLLDPTAWFWLVGFCGWGLLALYLLTRTKGRGLLGLGLFIPWVLFGTELATVRVQEIFVLYRGYLWFAALTVPLAWLLTLGLAHPRGRWLVLICWGAVAVFCVNAAKERIGTFATSYALWNDAVRLIETKERVPVFAERAYNNRGFAQSAMGDCHKALVDIDHALMLNSKMCIFHRNRAQCLLKLDQPAAAVKSYDEALRLCPKDNQGYWSRAAAKAAMGDIKGSDDDQRRACELGMQWACLVVDRKEQNLEGVISSQMIQRLGGAPP